MCVGLGLIWLLTVSIVEHQEVGRGSVYAQFAPGRVGLDKCESPCTNFAVGLVKNVI